MNSYSKTKLLRTIILCIMITGAISSRAQVYMTLKDLGVFESPSSNWHIAGDVSADLNTANRLVWTSGTGVLVNQPEQGVQAHDILFFPHNDLDLELDYMMAKGSNSGIYLQGRYEIQLLDSWTNLTTKAGDNGGIYERWNDSKPDGQKGFDGHAPRQNATRAPGLWQHIKISFQAPRFNESGQKIENARILRVELNGVLLHENVELSGPTRGPLVNDEVATGPLRFQGDHGPVAFRNIRLTAYGKPKSSPAANITARDPIDPIFINSNNNTILRSFMDIDTFRVTHAVSVGSPQQVQYTYDMDRGSIIQVWRGGFLDATPMWHSRGDGSSRPAGSVIRFGKPVPSLAVLSGPDAPWPKDSVGTGYRPKGYRLDPDDRPTFLYQVYNTMVKDKNLVMDGRQGIHREIEIDKPVVGMFFRLAEADKIELASDGTYLIDDKTYYIRVEDPVAIKPVIRDSNGHKQLIIPVQKNLSYSIIF
jgi:hypothetical protein